MDKSIIKMVAQEFPRAEHRRCARHLFANWHKSFKGEKRKMFFWNCALAYNKSDFDVALAEMREVDPRAAQAFTACNRTLFCRAFIGTRTTNNVIVNNMAETFNAFIINARSKYIIYMLEDIGTLLMSRLVKNRKLMEGSSAIVCPKIQIILEKVQEKDAYSTPLLSDIDIYQVQDGLDEVTVNLKDMTCTCRKWNVTGIPCSHAVAAIFELYRKAEDYVNLKYKRESYIKAYSNSNCPCPSERYWPKVDQPMIPLPIKIGPGRPRKKRIRDPHEDPKKSGKLTKHGLKLTCYIFKNNQPPPPKRERGRPKNLNPTVRAEAASSSQVQNQATAQPTRTGRIGKVIRGGGRGTAEGGRLISKGGRGRGRIPLGFGVLFDGQGHMFTNVEGRGPRTVHAIGESSTKVNTQVSSNQL